MDVQARSDQKGRAGHLTPVPQGVDGFDECWYPVAMSTEVGPGEVLGREFFDGRVVVFRTMAGEVSVVSAYCRHLGADLTDGEIVDDCLRCPFHHWSYDTSGVCVRTAIGDRVPKANSLFKFPTEERWGLIWAFNGIEPTYEVPGWPEPESERHFSVIVVADHVGGAPWLVAMNTLDVQHLRSLHGVESTDVELHETERQLHEGVYSLQMDITMGAPGSRIPPFTRHAEYVGTNTVVYSRATTGVDTMVSVTPYHGKCKHYVVTAALRSAVPPESIEAAVAERQQSSYDVVQEDLPIFEKIHFEADTLTSSDRPIATFLQWVNRYPRSHPSEHFIR
jgi:phenylpropionate dioxygenase-like ring-hydroxylating dioxygenase large terminal subunit